MNKKELRRIYKAKRNELSLEVRQTMNEALCARLKELDWSQCTYLHIYRPISIFNEPDVDEFIRWIQQEYPAVKLVVPQMDSSSGLLIHYVWDEQTEMRPNSWGINEPIHGDIVNESLIDVVLVPMLIVDEKGNRVGYGKGYYDRFLKLCKEDICTIGLCYFDPVGAIADADPWDVPLRYCITPSQRYSFM